VAIAHHNVFLCHWDGTRKAYLDSLTELSYTRVLHGVGVAVLTLPSSFDDSLAQMDYKIEVERNRRGTMKQLEVYLMRKPRRETDAQGVNRTVLTGVHGNDILQRRVVWAQPRSSQARKTGLMANVVKAFLREAIAQVTGSLICDSDAARGDIADYFTVQADNNEWTEYSATPASWATETSSSTETREYQTLLDLANGITARSTGRGYPIWWYVVPVSRYQFEFRTYKTLMGQDRTSQVLISQDNAMIEPVWEMDATEEFTVALAAGEKMGWETYPDYRLMAAAWNTVRALDNPFSWREKFTDGGAEDDIDHLRDLCSETVRDMENAPRERFYCKLQETSLLRYGLDYDLGDRVRFSYRGFTNDAVIKAVKITVGQTETIETILEIEPEMTIETSALE